MTETPATVRGFAWETIGCLVLLVAFLAGCGSSGSSPAPPAGPTPTSIPRFFDKSAGLTITVTKVILHSDHALLLVSLRNAHSTAYESPSTVPFRDTAFVEPTNGGTTSACDADESRGSGLNYLNVPGHTTHVGWIRCDYPGDSHLFVLIWQSNLVHTFRLTT